MYLFAVCFRCVSFVASYFSKYCFIHIPSWSTSFYLSFAMCLLLVGVFHCVCFACSHSSAEHFVLSIFCNLCSLGLCVSFVFPLCYCGCEWYNFDSVHWTCSVAPLLNYFCSIFCWAVGLLRSVLKSSVFIYYLLLIVIPFTLCILLSKLFAFGLLIFCGMMIQHRYSLWL